LDDTSTIRDDTPSLPPNHTGFDSIVVYLSSRPPAQVLAGFGSSYVSRAAPLGPWTVSASPFPPWSSCFDASLLWLPLLRLDSSSFAVQRYRQYCTVSPKKHREMRQTAVILLLLAGAVCLSSAARTTTPVSGVPAVKPDSDKKQPAAAAVSMHDKATAVRKAS
jgi:hypothetical protein